MMAHIGDHIKMTLPRHLRARTREFYAGLLACKVLESPLDDLDLYRFGGGFVVGLFFAEDEQALPEVDYLKATWLEIKVDDPLLLKTRLQEFGVREVEFPDPGRFYFQAPGGQVYRIAPMDGGL